MNTANTIAPFPQSRRIDDRALVGRSTWVLAALGLIVCAAIVAIAPPYTPGSTVGYRLGLIGGLMMLSLLLYPVRKSWPALYSWGPIKHWFRFHMVLGVTGPILVLFHSTFRVGSPNAAAALGSMLLVALSGIVGRFIYVRIHRGLYGSLSNLEEMLAEREKSSSRVRRLFDLVPEIEALLRAYTEHTQSQAASAIVRAWHFSSLSWRTWRTWRACSAILRKTIFAHGQAGRMRPEQRQNHYNEGAEMIRAYLSAAQRAAQFRTYDRLFSLWHVVHIPFIYMLAASAVIHVIAVHMY